MMLLCIIKDIDDNVLPTGNGFNEYIFKKKVIVYLIIFNIYLPTNCY